MIFMLIFVGVRKMKKMDSEKILNFFKHYVVVNLLTAVVLFAVLYFLAGWMLDSYSNHGESVVVPSLEKMSISDAEAIASGEGLSVKVTDTSYVFTREFNNGEVISQFPKAGSSVKPGRTIKLTIYAPETMMVKMPLLNGLSRRDAVAKLRTLHLTLGRKTYVNDIETGRIQKQMCNGKVIAAGEMIPAGSVIDVHISRNDENRYTIVPNMTGMTYAQVLRTIEDSNLNAGKYVFDRKNPSFKQKMEAVAYKQSLNAEQSIETGSSISVYFHIQD